MNKAIIVAIVTFGTSFYVQYVKAADFTPSQLRRLPIVCRDLIPNVFNFAQQTLVPGTFGAKGLSDTGQSEKACNMLDQLARKLDALRGQSAQCERFGDSLMPPDPAIGEVFRKLSVEIAGVKTQAVGLIRNNIGCNGPSLDDPNSEGGENGNPEDGNAGSTESKDGMQYLHDPQLKPLLDAYASTSLCRYDVDIGKSTQMIEKAVGHRSMTPNEVASFMAAVIDAGRQARVGKDLTDSKALSNYCAAAILDFGNEGKVVSGLLTYRP